MNGMDPARALFFLILVGITVAIAIVLNTAGPVPGHGTANGTLAGSVTIGPLCPVEPCRVTADQLRDVYAAHPIVIATPGGMTVAELTADPENGYSVTLRPGTYVVDTARTGPGGSRGLPATVTIRSGVTVLLNVTIETGIR